MIDIGYRWAEATWAMLVDSAFLLLVGIVLAGLLHLVLNETNIGRLLKTGTRADIIRAALLGVPLPLCSCSVLPVARELHRSGVSRSATISFLISTPETGIDSILLTYSLTDPLLTIARPLTAFASAVTAGLWQSTSSDKEELVAMESEPECCDGCATEVAPQPDNWPRKLWRGVRYAFSDLLADLAPYLLFGYLLAGLATVALGGDFLGISESVRSGWSGYIVALLVGLPLYICATSSTPMAAALLSLGFSPGAILVFLMVGPATNIASLVVVARILRRWALVRYLISITVVAILFGIALDFIYSWLDMSGHFIGMADIHESSTFDIAAAVLLSLFVLYFVARKFLRRLA